MRDMKVEGGVEAQARQALKNLKAVVEAGGSELGKIVKTTVRMPCLVPSLCKGIEHKSVPGRCSCTTWTTSNP